MLILCRISITGDRIAERLDVGLGASADEAIIQADDVEVAAVREELAGDDAAGEAADAGNEEAHEMRDET